MSCPVLKVDTEIDRYPVTEGKNFWELYALFNIHDWRLSSIDKMAMLRQTPKLLALFFVVAFGSSLDVAAIQAGVPDTLDYNHELKTVGTLSD